MKRYVKASFTSGLIGIWWLYDNLVIADLKTLDDGYTDGPYVNYDQRKNHMTEWRRLIKEYLPENIAETVISQGFKSLERGRVVFNIRTHCYEIICSEKVHNNIDQLKLIVDAFELRNCRYDIVTDPHYHIAPLTGNKALDDLEYGFF